MATSFRKKLFLFIFCLASIIQGMYSTYFVSILTTIERVYQIQSKTAGAILSATEMGQILGSLFIAYYGGRGNKPKWISLCMTLSALAALISISPQFLLSTSLGVAARGGRAASGAAHRSENPITDQTQSSSSSSNFAIGNETNMPTTPLPYLASDLRTRATPALTNGSPLSALELPSLDDFCRTERVQLPLPLFNSNESKSSRLDMLYALATDNGYQQQFPVTFIIAIFFTCLLAIGFGSTAITTLGIPFMDDIISKEESPLYLGMTIGLKIFGPALGFLLGSFCIRLNSNSILSAELSAGKLAVDESHSASLGAWWLGLVLISLPLLVLAIPMYCLSRKILPNDSEREDYHDITYQAAEDHDIGGSHDFPAHILSLGSGGGGGGGGDDDLDVTSSKTCLSSELDASSSREVLQIRSHSPGHFARYNYNQNIAFEQPIFSNETLATEKSKLSFETISDSDEQQEGAGTAGAASDAGEWRSQNVCLVVNHFGGLESKRFTNANREPAFKSSRHENSSSSPPSSSLSRSSAASTSDICSYPSREVHKKQQPPCLAQPHDVLALSNLSSSLSRLIKSRLLALRMLSSVLHILPIAGFYTFLPKYLIEQFRISSSSASAISGLAGILFVGFGAFMGGTIIRLFNVNSRFMTRWIASSALLYAIGMLILMNLGCTNNQIVHHNSREFALTDCSLSCHCSKDVFNPVCANGTTYLSPCLAGCKAHTIAENKIIFDECGCSTPSQPGPLDFESANVSRTDSHVNLNVATRGPCTILCDNLIWYVILFSLFTFAHASSEVGAMIFNLRCVKSDDRTLALGLITFTSSLFGTIPCSIIYGSIVDHTCVHWDRIITTLDASAGGQAHEARGACRAYENGSFRYYLHGVTALVMFLAFIVDCIISTRAREVNFYDGKGDSKTQIRMALKRSDELCDSK